MKALKGYKGYADVLVEFRFSDATPQHRLLGAFIAKDVFVAHSLVLRTDLDKSWAIFCKAAISEITNLGNPPLNVVSPIDPNYILSNWKYAK